jgi:hypothetical protein
LAPNSPSFETPTPVTWLDTLNRLLSSVKFWDARGAESPVTRAG